MKVLAKPTPEGKSTKRIDQLTDRLVASISGLSVRTDIYFGKAHKPDSVLLAANSAYRNFFSLWKEYWSLENAKGGMKLAEKIDSDPYAIIFMFHLQKSGIEILGRLIDKEVSELGKMDFKPYLLDFTKNTVIVMRFFDNKQQAEEFAHENRLSFEFLAAKEIRQLAEAEKKE